MQLDASWPTQQEQEQNADEEQRSDHSERAQQHEQPSDQEFDEDPYRLLDGEMGQPARGRNPAGRHSPAESEEDEDPPP